MGELGFFPGKNAASDLASKRVGRFANFDELWFQSSSYLSTTNSLEYDFPV